MGEHADPRTSLRRRAGRPATATDLCGELDLAAAGSLRQQLAPLLVAGSDVVLVGASGVEFIDCAGLRELLLTQRRLRARGRRLVLVAPSPALSRLLEITGLAHWFDASRPVPRGTRLTEVLIFPAWPLSPSRSSDDDRLVLRERMLHRRQIMGLRDMRSHATWGGATPSSRAS